MQQDNEGSLRGLVRQLSIDQFENEGRRVDPESSAKHQKTPFFERPSMDPGNVHKVWTGTSCFQALSALAPLAALSVASGLYELQLWCELCTPVSQMPTETLLMQG